MDFNHTQQFFTNIRDAIKFENAVKREYHKQTQANFEVWHNNHDWQYNRESLNYFELSRLIRDELGDDYYEIE